MADEEDQLARLLGDNWEITGYSTFIMAAGAVMHSILLKKEANVTAINIVKNGGKEIGRTVDVLSPMPQKSRGLWS